MNTTLRSYLSNKSRYVHFMCPGESRARCTILNSMTSCPGAVIETRARPYYTCNIYNNLHNIRNWIYSIQWITGQLCDGVLTKKVKALGYVPR